MGTALGDFTAYTLHLGYFPSAVILAWIIALPMIGYRWLRWNVILSFWFAYVITKPLGASIADGLGRSKSSSGMGLGGGCVALAISPLILVLVAFLAFTGSAVQQSPGTKPERS